MRETKDWKSNSVMTGTARGACELDTYIGRAGLAVDVGKEGDRVA
jgi:hypothetical protein